MLITTFIQIRIIDIVDILLVAILLYALYNLLKGTMAINIFLGIVAIALIWVIVDALNMKLLGLILGAFINVGFIALIIIFQPEIRQFLFTIGTNKLLKKISKKLSFMGVFYENNNKLDIETISAACISMSEGKVGALIVISRENQLSEIINTGVTINAEISKPLIENIFFKNSPLHDGAMIITNNRIVAARCILPVTKRTDIPGHYGLRHRAALGLVEEKDPIVIVVSEETGNISFAYSGQIRTIPTLKVSSELQKMLSEE